MVDKGYGAQEATARQDGAQGGQRSEPQNFRASEAQRSEVRDRRSEDGIWILDFRLQVLGLGCRLDR
jgi:hypothetical protein